MYEFFKKAKNQPKFGIETSKGIIYVSETPQEPIKSQETSAKFKQRKEVEKEVERVLNRKLEADIEKADDFDYTKLFNKDNLVFKGSKELEIILDTTDFLKNQMLKKGTKADLNVSLADKSGLIACVYKELEDQRQKCKALKKELEEALQVNNEKTDKIKTLQNELKKLKANNEKLNANYKKLLVEDKILQRLLLEYKQKQEELNKMQYHELEKLHKVFYKSRIGK